jgi:hypothetical protein
MHAMQAKILSAEQMEPEMEKWAVCLPEHQAAGL